jgi:hypothetical protein
MHLASCSVFENCTMPPRPRPAASDAADTSAAAPSATNRGNINARGASNLQITMPASLGMHEIKKYQNLFIAMAQVCIRAEGTLSTQEQQARLLANVETLISRWFVGDAALRRIPHFPECPQALTSLGTAQRVINVLKCTTATGRSCMDNAAMLARAKEIKKEMLAQIANWNMLCGYPANCRTFGVPGSGKTRDTVYKELVSVDWRVNQTRKLLKLLISCRGVQFAHSAHCTEECIMQARRSVYFASRGLFSFSFSFSFSF